MPTFVQPAVYRRRRIMDAARMLPVLGAALFLVPLLWAGSGNTARGGIYVFAVWLGLIVVARVLAAALSRPDPGPDAPAPPRPPAP